MKALILAGGKSTRLYPLTFSIPKPMVPMLNRPFLEHMIDWLRQHGVRDIVLATSYLPEAIREHFRTGDAHGVHIEYMVEPQPLDTGGAIKNAEALLDERFFVFNGDILTGLDLEQMAREHAASSAQISIALTWVEDPTPYGVIETDDQGRVLRFREKPQPDEVTSHYINAGTYIFEPGLLRDMPAGTRFSVERDFYPQALQRGVCIHGYRDSSYWLDIGTADKYRQAHRDIMMGKVLRRGRGEEIEPGLWAGSHVHLASDATIVPPVVMGDRCDIGPRAQLGPYAILGDDVEIAEDARVADSILWNNARVGSAAEIQGSVIGSNVVVAPGTHMAGEAVASEEQLAR